MKLKICPKCKVGVWHLYEDADSMWELECAYCGYRIRIRMDVLHGIEPQKTEQSELKAKPRQ
jgi:DNA-directed RNA polymerase subunit RPC12/RpoP